MMFTLLQTVPVPADPSNIWPALIHASPGLAVAVFMVIVFLKHISKLDDRSIKQQEQHENRCIQMQEANAEVVKQLALECHKEQERITTAYAAAIDKVSSALLESSKALAVCSRVLERIEGNT